jgi:NAD(P)-dependent dehydrogenase (short-subunit alcohol dehydrogenase family)
MLAADGLTVVAVDRTEHALSDLPQEIRREVADATDPAEAARLIDRIAGEVGPPDVLVNTIGEFRPEDVLATTPEMLRLMLDVNLGPALWLTQAGAADAAAGVRRHRARGRPPRDRASRPHGRLRGEQAALVHLTRIMDIELRPQGVQVNAVAPEAIADVIAFLVSDAAAPVSGAILPAYGA